MAERVKVLVSPQPEIPQRLKDLQESKEDKAPVFYSTGSTLLNLVIGGGWALGRCFNIVGDKSTGKTLLAVEAFANFAKSFPEGRMRYAESEAAFDDIFADQLGMPSNVERPNELLCTVQEFRNDFYRFIDKGGPGIYILDSLDALTDDAELKKFEQQIKAKKKAEDSDGEEKEEKVAGSYGTGKAKGMSEFFRLMVRDAAAANITLGIISQIRDNIGAMFGNSYQRTGGHAMDFYMSQVIWLAELGKEKHSAMGIERVTGIDIKAKCTKLKVGFPFREAEMKLVLGYGIDNHISMLNWLKMVGALKDEEGQKKGARYAALKKQIEDARDKQDYEFLDKIEQELTADVTRIWKEVDTKLSPTVQKYRR